MSAGHVVAEAVCIGFVLVAGGLVLRDALGNLRLVRLQRRELRERAVALRRERMERRFEPRVFESEHGVVFETHTAAEHQAVLLALMEIHALPETSEVET